MLAQLPSSLQVEVVRRLADLDQADPHVLEDVEHGLQNWLSDQARHRQRRAQGLAAVSAILDAAPADARRRIMTNLSRADRPLAGKLRANHYRFADLMQFDDAALMAVLRAADPELIVLALAGATVEFVERIRRRLPAEPSRALTKALAHLGPTRLADVEEAQQALADLATEISSEVGPAEAPAHNVAAAA